jgi:hypothetical protein
MKKPNLDEYDNNHVSKKDFWLFIKEPQSFDILNSIENAEQGRKKTKEKGRIKKTA